MTVPTSVEACEHRPIAAVVLAAGASTRLGKSKQLLTYRGQPLVAHAATAALAAGASPVIVVLGANAAMIAPVLGGIGDLHLVTNERWKEGLASSLAAGVSAALATEPDIDAILIAVSDQPLVDAAALRKLMQTFNGDVRLVAAEYAGTVGVPAVVGREYFDDLCSLRGDAGAGRWLRARLDSVTCVPVPDAAFDIDTVADAERLT